MKKGGSLQTPDGRPPTVDGRLRLGSARACRGRVSSRRGSRPREDPVAIVSGDPRRLDGVRPRERARARAEHPLAPVVLGSTRLHRARTDPGSSGSCSRRSGSRPPRHARPLPFQDDLRASVSSMWTAGNQAKRPDCWSDPCSIVPSMRLMRPSINARSRTDSHARSCATPRSGSASVWLPRAEGAARSGRHPYTTRRCPARRPSPAARTNG